MCNSSSDTNTNSLLLDGDITKSLIHCHDQSTDLPYVKLQKSSTDKINDNQEDSNKDNSSQVHYNNINQHDHDCDKSCDSDTNHQIMAEFDRLIPASTASQVVASLGIDFSPEIHSNKPPSVVDANKETQNFESIQKTNPLEHQNIQKSKFSETNSTSVSASVSVIALSSDASNREEATEIASTTPIIEPSTLTSKITNSNDNESNDKNDEIDNLSVNSGFNNNSDKDDGNAIPVQEYSQQSDNTTLVASSLVSPKTIPLVSGSTTPDHSITANDGDKVITEDPSSLPLTPLLSNTIDLFLGSSSFSGEDSSKLSSVARVTTDTSINEISKETTTNINPVKKSVVSNSNETHCSVAAKKDQILSEKNDAVKLSNTINDNALTPVENSTNIAKDKLTPISTSNSSITTVINYPNSSSMVSKSITDSFDLGISTSIKYHKTAALAFTQSTSSTAMFDNFPLAVTGLHKNKNETINHLNTNVLNTTDSTISFSEPINKSLQNTQSLSFFGNSNINRDIKLISGAPYNESDNFDSLDVNNNSIDHENGKLLPVIDHYPQFTQNDIPVLADIAAAAMALAHRYTSSENTASMIPDELGVSDIKKLIIKSVYGQKVETDAEICKVLAGTNDNDINKHNTNIINNHNMSNFTNNSIPMNTKQIHYFRIPHMSVAGGRKLWLTTNYQVLGQDHAGYMYIQHGKNQIYRFLWDLSDRMHDVWAPIPTRGWVQDEIALLKRVDAVLTTPSPDVSDGGVVAGMNLINSYIDHDNNNTNYNMVLDEEFSSLSSLSTSEGSLYDLEDEYETKIYNTMQSSDTEESFLASNLSNSTSSPGNGPVNMENLMVYISTSESSEENNNSSMMLIDHVKRSKRKRRSIDRISSVITENETRHNKNINNNTESYQNGDEGQNYSEQHNDQYMSSDEWTNPLPLSAFGRLRAGYESHDSFSEDHDEENSNELPPRMQFTLRLLKTKRTPKPTPTPPPPPSLPSLFPKSKSLVPENLGTGGSYILNTRSGRQCRLPTRFFSDGLEKDSFLPPPKKKKKKKQVTNRAAADLNSQLNAKATRKPVLGQKRRNPSRNQHQSRGIPKLRLTYGETTAIVGASKRPSLSNVPAARASDKTVIAKTVGIKLNTTHTKTSNTTKFTAKSTTMAHPNTVFNSSSSRPPSTESLGQFPNKFTVQSTNLESVTNFNVSLNQRSPPPELLPPVLSARTQRQQARRGGIDQNEDGLVVVDISSDED